MSHGKVNVTDFFKEEEEIELARDNSGNYVIGKTGYPKPVYRRRLVLEESNMNLEEHYFWLYENFKMDQGFPQQDIIKITDIFAASEQSAFFGSAQQRLGLQQDKVSQFLATIGKMVKELFQLVREIRILDERLAYYEDSFSDKKTRESAEITLKGIWIDVVEQGSKNPASVYGMARELQFTVLPDLFFSIHPKTAEEVESMVDKLEFNRKVKEVLKRKLRTYIEWKKSTYLEIKNRRIFTLKYLRQHFDIIKMYMAWVKPYLRNIRRLQLADETKSPELISAFETAIIEIELLCKKLAQNKPLGELEITTNKHVYSVVIMSIIFRSTPSMSYHQEYQKGPVHVGMIDMTLRAYTWTEDEIKKYMEFKDKEDMALLMSIDASVKAAMEALGDELENYLKEAGERIEFEKKHGKEEKKGPATIYDPFVSVFKGVGELFGIAQKKEKSKKKIVPSYILEDERGVAQSAAKSAVWQTYKNFKKRVKMLNW